MKQGITITVSDLGPIKGPCSVELNNFIIFSGRSGLGKSYLAMLVHFVYRMLLGIDLLDFLEFKKIDYAKLRNAAPDEEELTVCEIPTSELVEWLNEQAVRYIQQMTGNPKLQPVVNITFDNLPDSFVFKSYRNTIITPRNGTPEVVEYVRLNENGDNLEIKVSFSAMGNVSLIVLWNQFFKRKYGIYPGDHFFLPPSRGGILTLPSSAIFNNRDSMGMYYEFLFDFEQLKSRKFAVMPAQSETLTRFLHDNVLEGEVKIDDNNMLVYKMHREQGVPIPITAAASSIKEMAPLALIVEKKRASDYSILFEEPESHLHPEMQIAVADLMTAMVKVGAHFQITTHSDYLLRRINDLIFLFLIKQKMDAADFEAYCHEVGVDPELTLNPGLVNAYYLHDGPDGHTAVAKQELRDGVPFDTFDNVVDTSIQRSAEIYEKLTSLQYENAD